MHFDLDVASYFRYRSTASSIQLGNRFTEMLVAELNAFKGVDLPDVLLQLQSGIFH